MTGTSLYGSVIDIGATVEKHGIMVDSLMAAHATSGCDTGSPLYGIGKGTVIQLLKPGLLLDMLGRTDCDIAEIVQQATVFISLCYGPKDADDISAVRFEMWTMKMSSKRLTSAPELKMLPPTTQAFQLHVKRTHYQTALWTSALWKSALEIEPPSIDPKDFGWTLDYASNILLPLPLPPDVPSAPDSVI